MNWLQVQVGIPQKPPFLFFIAPGEVTTVQPAIETELALKSNLNFDGPGCDADTVSIISELSEGS